MGFNSGIFGRSASFEWGINQALTVFVGTFVGILISSWVISQLAPKFGITLSFANAVKLVAYSYTPSLLAGVFYLIPALTALVVAGSIYSLYVLYVGFQPITNVSEEQKINYFLLSMVSIVAIFIVLSIVLGILFATMGFAGYRAAGL
ncbi:MAG TPA: Yip1 family protein [Prolixibacteraceae bacterium]|nr:Yip1 family protein [Prolixibacteraceae bacterium]